MSTLIVLGGMNTCTAVLSHKGQGYRVRDLFVYYLSFSHGQLQGDVATRQNPIMVQWGCNLWPGLFEAITRVLDHRFAKLSGSIMRRPSDCEAVRYCCSARPVEKGFSDVLSTMTMFITHPTHKPLRSRSSLQVVHRCSLKTSCNFS